MYTEIPGLIDTLTDSQTNLSSFVKPAEDVVKRCSEATLDVIEKYEKIQSSGRSIKTQLLMFNLIFHNIFKVIFL